MITVFYARSLSLNRSFNVIFEALLRKADSTLQVVDVSCRSFDEILALSRASELVAVDNYIYWAGSTYNRARRSSAVFWRWRGKAFYEDVFNALLDSKAVRLYLALGLDLHWPGPLLDRLLRRIDALAWLYEKRPVVAGEVPKRYAEEWMHAKDEKMNDPFAHWQKVRQMVPVRIELLHSLGSNEFSKRPAAKIWDICVPGVGYATRQIATHSAHQSRLKVAPFAKVDARILKWTEVPARVMPVLTTVCFIRLRQFNQRFLIKHSRVGFACGSGLKYAVRKFLEVPAQRTAMIVYPCSGFKNFGFSDGENVVCAEPEEVGRAARSLVENDAFRERIAAKGWETTLCLHSAERRATDLVECMRRLARGRLRNAQFIDGRYDI